MKSTGFGKTQSRIENKLFGALLLAFAGLITTSAGAYADGHCEHEQWGHHGHWNKEKHAEFFQKHQKALHDKLAITAAQEPAWSSFVARTTPTEIHQHADWAEVSKLPTPERLDRFVAAAKEREQTLEVRAQATKELYKQLTPDQQKIFDTSLQHHLNDHDHG